MLTANFWLNGLVNKARQTLHALNHPENGTVWRGLLTGGLIGPYFLKDVDN